jgi:hypothetical protein
LESRQSFFTYAARLTAVAVFGPISSLCAHSATAAGGASTQGTMPPGGGTVGTGDIVWQDAASGEFKLAGSPTGSQLRVAGSLPSFQPRVVGSSHVQKVNYCVRIGVTNTNESGFSTLLPIELKLRRSAFSAPVVNAQIGHGLAPKSSMKLTQHWCEFGIPKNQLPVFIVELTGQDVLGFPAKNTTQIKYPCPVSSSEDIVALAQSLATSPPMPGSFGCGGVGIKPQPTHTK